MLGEILLRLSTSCHETAESLMLSEMVLFQISLIGKKALNPFIFLLQAQKRELDHIRQNYRKNSLARTPVKSPVSRSPIAVFDESRDAEPPMVLVSSESGGGPGGGAMGGSDDEDDEDEDDDDEDDVDDSFDKGDIQP